MKEHIFLTCSFKGFFSERGITVIKTVLIIDKHSSFCGGLKSILQIKLPQYQFEAVPTDEIETIKGKPDLIILSFEAMNEANILNRLSNFELRNTKIALMFLRDEIKNVNFKNNWVQGYLLKNMSTSEWVFSILNLLSGSPYIHSAFSHQLLNTYRNN